MATSRTGRECLYSRDWSGCTCFAPAHWGKHDLRRGGMAWPNLGGMSKQQTWCRIHRSRFAEYLGRSLTHARFDPEGCACIILTDCKSLRGATQALAERVSLTVRSSITCRPRSSLPPCTRIVPKGLTLCVLILLAYQTTLKDKVP